MEFTNRLIRLEEIMDLIQCAGTIAITEATENYIFSVLIELDSDVEKVSVATIQGARREGYYIFDKRIRSYIGGSNGRASSWPTLEGAYEFLHQFIQINKHDCLACCMFKVIPADRYEQVESHFCRF